MRPYLVFDVNETLLDLNKLDPLFEEGFGSTFYRKAWFDQVLKSAFVNTIIGEYQDFGVVARSALEMIAERSNVYLEPEIADQILAMMRSLSPHPEVLEAISDLKEAGFDMAALTNSPPEVAQAQLEYAEIAPFPRSHALCRCFKIFETCKEGL